MPPAGFDVDFEFVDHHDLVACVCALTEVRPRRPASPTLPARRIRRTAVLPSSCPRPACGRRCSLHFRRAVRVCSGQIALRQRREHANMRIARSG